jgi:small-conductance mechanosensitive channel
LTQNYIDILLWVIALPAGWFVGKLLKMTLFPVLHKQAQKTENDLDDALIDAASRLVVPLFWIVGVWVSYHYSDLFNDYNNQIKKAAEVFSVLIGTWTVSHLVTDLAQIYIFRVGKSLPNTSIFSNLLKIIIYSIGIVFVMHVLGIPIAPALTALGVSGLAVALALQDTLSNLFAGLQMLAAKKIKPGDYVKLEGGDEGFVRDIAWRNTTITALGNHLIIVPNSTMAEGIVKNYILPDSQNSVLVPVGVSYNSDLKQVERVAIEVGIQIQKSIEGAVKDHIPVIRFNEFADSSINFKIILRSSDFTSQYMMTHEFIKALHERFNKEGIEIPFPIRTVHLKKE